MRTRQSLARLAEIALIAMLLIAVDAGLFEAIYHMWR